MQIRELPLNKQFLRRLIKPNVWVITCYSDGGYEGANPHVIVGDKYAMVVDATDTKNDLRKYIQTYITENPIIIASTHAHFDHTLTNALFNDCPIYMSQVAWEETQELRKNNYEGHAKDRFVGDYTPNIIKEGDIIDLGGCKVEAINFGGCHNRGSISFLDHRDKLFFPGDELEAGQLLMQGDKRGGTNSVELLHDNLLLLKNRESEIDYICPPHNGTPMHISIIDAFLENCVRILNGISGDGNVGSATWLLSPNESRPKELVEQILSDPQILRSEWKGSTIVYSTNRIYKHS